MTDDGLTQEARASVNQAVIDVVLPNAYSLIDQLLEHSAGAPKALIAEARLLLPAGYKNSFFVAKK